MLKVRQVRNHFQNLRTKIMRKFALADVNADADFATEKFAHADADTDSCTVVRIWMRISA